MPSKQEGCPPAESECRQERLYRGVSPEFDQNGLVQGQKVAAERQARETYQLEDDSDNESMDRLDLGQDSEDSITDKASRGRRYSCGVNGNIGTRKLNVCRGRRSVKIH